MPVPQVEMLLPPLKAAGERFVYGLEKTPDDRLNWSVADTGRTPLVLAGKVAGFVGFLGHVIAEKSAPDGGGGFPPPPDSRATAIAAVNGAFERLLAALEGLTSDDLARTVRAPWGKELEIRAWATFALTVSGYFQGQLNLTQLAYGDEDPNIPPSWRGE